MLKYHTVCIMKILFMAYLTPLAISPSYLKNCVPWYPAYQVIIIRLCSSTADRISASGNANKLTMTNTYKQMSTLKVAIAIVLKH